jgi:type IV pilus assembly protein PilB
LTNNDEYILEILQGVGLISQAQAEECLRWAQENDRPVIDALVYRKVATKSDILKTLAGQFGMEFVSLSGLEVDQSVIDLVPGDVARRYKIVPLYRNDSNITVALSDPLDVETLDSLRYILHCGVEPNVALPEEIEAALDRYYPATASTLATLMQEEMTEGTITGPAAGTPRLEGRGRRHGCGCADHQAGQPYHPGGVPQPRV